MRFLYVLLTILIFATNADATILVSNPNGGAETVVPNLLTAATGPYAGRTITVTSNLSASFSNFSSATTHGVWPSDRALTVIKGGVINPTTKFTGLPYAEPEWFGVNTTPGTTDMTTAIRRAIAAAPYGEVKFNDLYKVNTAGTPFAISIYQHLVGINRKTARINNIDTSGYTFAFRDDSAGDIDAGFIFENITLSAKFGIQFGVNGANHSLLTALKGITIRNNTFIGAYSGDALIETATYPAVNADYSDNELLPYGCAINAAKILDSLIQMNLFIGHGIALYLDGSDINTIDTNRFQGNGRHVHVFDHDYGGFSWGHQNKIQNNDMLTNYRRGAIFDAAAFTTIRDNYFETYSLAGEAITQRFKASGLIDANRFDTSGTATPIMSLAPSYGLVVSNNRTNPNTPTATIEVLNTNYGISTTGRLNNYLVKFSGNSGSFTPTKQPFCEYDFNDPRVFDAYNPKILSGTPANTWPFKTSGTSGKQVITTAADSIGVAFETLPTDSVLEIAFTGTYINNAGFCTISWGGTAVFGDYVGFTNTAGVKTHSIRISRPAVAPDSGLAIAFFNTQVELQSITVKDVEDDYRTGTATPVGSIPPRFVGERYLDTTGVKWYMSTGLTGADWVALN